MNTAMLRTKKLIALALSFCFAIEAVFPAVALAASPLIGSITFISPSQVPSPPRTNPWSDVVLKLQGVKPSGLATDNPQVSFSATQTGYSLVNAGSWYVTASSVTTYYPVTDFNPPSSATGTVNASLPVGTAAFGLSGTTVNVPQSYPFKTFDFSVTYTASGFLSVTKTWSVAINVVPHVRTVSFNKPSLISNGIDTVVLETEILDRNGCADIASAHADFSALWGSTIEPLTQVSCAADGVTATYRSSAFTTFASPGTKTISVTAMDSSGHLQGSDSVFSADDLQSSNTITVNSPTAPVVTVGSVTPQLLKAGSVSSVTWQSSQTGSYRVYAGPAASCGVWTPVETWNVATANANVVSSVSVDALSEGSNLVTVCVTNSEPTEWSVSATLVRDTVAPTVSAVSSTNNIVSQDVTASFSANEAGTYRFYVNDVNVGVTGSYSGWSATQSATLPNSVFTVDPGNNSVYVTVTDAAGNEGKSATSAVYKDGTPPPPTTSVSLSDCDYVGNSATPCAALGNPRNGLSWRDFHVTWTPPADTASGTFESYRVYVLPQWTPFTATGLTVLKWVTDFSHTGTFLDGTTVTDSLGNPFSQTGSSSYVAYVVVRKSNGLESTVASSAPATVTSDAITYPQFVSAAFTSGTGISVTFSKPLSTALSDFDSSKISSPTGCFLIDSTSGTWAKSVSWSTVTFALENLSDGSKTCSNLSVTPGLVRDSEWLSNEDSVFSSNVSDAQIPTISVSSPTAGAFIAGNGVFTLLYSLSESMSGATLFANFTDGSGSVVSASLASAATAGNKSKTLTGSSIGLLDGRTYSLAIAGKDLWGNVASSSAVNGITYDVSAPSVPNLALPSANGYVNVSAVPLSWAGSTDNASSSAAITYEIQVSYAPDFSVMSAFGNVSGWAVSYAMNPGAATNTGYYWRVRSSDAAGNVGSWSASRTFFFDNVAPAISSLGSESYVWNASRSFSGYVKNGDDVQLRSKITDNYLGTLYSTGITANLSGYSAGASVAAGSFASNLATWDFTANCADGSKTATVTAYDLAGNSASSGISAICDNAAPSVTNSVITSPSASSYVSWGSSASVVWDASFYASEASPVSNPVTVETSSDGGSSWSVVAASVANGGSVPWTVPTVDTANFKVRLTAVDKLSNSASGTVTLTVDSTNPSVSADALTFPNGGEYLKGSTWTGVTVLWNPSKISDANIAAAPISLDYSVDGTNWTNIASSLPNTGSYAWTAGALDSNTVKVRITATDKVGRTTSDASDAVFSVDSTLPTVTPSTPPTPPTGSFLSNSGFDLGVSGTDLNLSKVSYSITDGSFYWNASSSSWLGGQQWNDLCSGSAACANASGVATPTLSDGSAYQFVYRSTDRAGNVKDSATYSYVADLVPPSLTKSVADGSSYSGSVAVSGTASDARSGVSSVRVSVKRLTDGKYWGGSSFDQSSENLLLASTSNAYANWSLTGFSVPAGDADGTTYLLSVLWTDKAYRVNNEFSTGATITKDSTWPSIAADVWTYPTANQFWKGANSKTLLWNPAKITDAISWVDSTAGITVEYATGAGVWHVIATSYANSGSLDWMVPVLDADINFRISAKDNLGNVSAGVVSPTVTVDTLQPQISTVETMDRAASGKIDGLLVTMSEPINCSTLRTVDFTVAWVGTPTATSGCAGSSQTFVLEFVPYGDTSSAPWLTYAPSWTLEDRAGNALSPVSKLSVDKAVPRLLSATVLDSNSNGKIDRIKAVFSENLSATSDTAAWTLLNPLPWMASSPSAVSVSASWATLTFSEPTAFETSTGGVSLAFAGGSPWKDAANNVSAPKASQPLSDGAAPKIVSASTYDASGAYAVDVVFSEALQTPNFSGLSFSGTSTYTGTNAQISSKSYRFATSDSTQADTAKTYSYSYVPGTLSDSSGNLLASVGATSVADAVAPKIVTRKTRDADGNGKIDSVVFGFSESLNGNVSGVTATVAGYSVSSYASSGTGLTANLVERSVTDTDAAPAVQLSNVSLADASGNAFASETAATVATDSVWPVVQSVRYDGVSKVVVTLSEAFSGTPANDWFVFSGTSVSVSSASALAGNEIELNVSGTVTYGTTSVSAASWKVKDASNNAQTPLSYSKISATVVINEVMWSSSGSSLTQYVELRNLWPTPIDVSGFLIEGAASNGTASITLPAGQTVPGNGYYLIAASAVSTAGNLLSPSVSPNYVWALSMSPAQTSNIVLKNGLWSVYDRAKANPFPAGSDSGVVSMERKDTPGDGLSGANWYSAQTGASLFDTVWPKGTPGQANVFDATAPTVTSATPADGKLFATGTGITATYAYSDDVLMPPSPTRSFKLEMNDGLGNYSSVTATGVSSSWADASQTHYALNALARGAYRATFTVSDNAWNQAQKVTNFFVDSFSMSVSSNSANIGVLDPNSVISASPITVTVTTVGAPFVLSLSGWTLSAGYDGVASWNGNSGYAFGCAVSGSAGGPTCDSSRRAVVNSVLENVSGASPEANGNLKTYSYSITFSAKPDELNAAWTYSSNHLISVVSSY